MKTILLVIPAAFALSACDKNSTAEVPKAVEVNEEVIVVADPPPVAEMIEEAEEEAEELAEELEEAAEAADPNRPRTPGEHLDRALGKTGQGLQVAGEKTEEGLEKAAEKTGEFLKRVGERIEGEADRVEEP